MVKFTAIAFGILCRCVTHCSKRFVSVAVEFVLLASMGSGSPESTQWLTMRKFLSVPPRFGLQLKSAGDLKLKGVSSETLYVLRSQGYGLLCYSFITMSRRGLSSSFLFLGTTMS